MFYRIDNMLVHKTSLSKFKKTEIISNIFSHYNGMKLEIDHKKKREKPQKKKKKRLTNVLLKKHWVIKERF